MRAVVALGVVVLAAGCGGVDEGDYVRRNVDVLESLPTFPGAVAGSTTSSPCRSSELPWARTAGYYTTREYLLPEATRPDRVVAFYAQHADGWSARERSAAPSVNLYRGDAFVHVLAGRGSYTVGVDHASAGCPGP